MSHPHPHSLSILSGPPPLLPPLLHTLQCLCSGLLHIMRPDKGLSIPSWAGKTQNSALLYKEFSPRAHRTIRCFLGNTDFYSTLTFLFPIYC